MKIEVVAVRPDAIIPTKGSKGSAGWDLYADIKEPVIIQPGQSKMIPSGVAFAIPEGYFGAVYARSGLSTKRGLRPSTCVSVIDSDYRGEVMLPIYNDSDSIAWIEPYERVSQIVFQPVPEFVLTEVEEFSTQTERGSGGFGSTGTK